LSRIYTRTGDAGETGLFGGGRVSKAHVRVEAYGSVDELNAAIGWVIAQGPDRDMRARLQLIQSDLFVMGAQLAAPAPARGRRPSVPDIPKTRVAEFERWIDEAEDTLPELRHFILPGGSAVGAALHLARTVCRRAERQVVNLASQESVAANVIVYLNRLSDFLFVLARSANRSAGITEHEWRAPEQP
jgi:cob(I)alamin adenosyltransferase